MEANRSTGYDIAIDQDDKGYEVRLMQNGHERYRAEALQTFSGVYEQTIQMMLACQVGIADVSIPYRLIAGIPLADCRGWTFARYCLDHARIKEPDVLV